MPCVTITFVGNSAEHKPASRKEEMITGSNCKTCGYEGGLFESGECFVIFVGRLSDSKLFSIYSMLDRNADVGR